METDSTGITDRILKRLKCPLPSGRVLKNEIKNLSDFFPVISEGTQTGKYWFRGQHNSSWPLRPSALRPDKAEKIDKVLGLWREFQKIAEIKLQRPPRPQEKLKWLQLAQHYGIPTRLLDWTESALFGLYFACISSGQGKDETDGIVYMLNPNDLTKIRRKPKFNTLDSQFDEMEIDKYLNLDSKETKGGEFTIAINPVWNSERLLQQRGKFTLHGSKRHALDEKQAPSLICLPILKEHKGNIRKELDNIGIDEITLFPEVEYVSKSLLRRLV